MSPFMSDDNKILFPDHVEQKLSADIVIKTSTETTRNQRKKSVRVDRNVFIDDSRR